MNYGFIPGVDPDYLNEILLDPSEERHRCQIQLYDHLARKVDLIGKNILEIGCGRGGGARYITRYLQPATYTGMDLIPAAVRYGAVYNEHAHCRFLAGDAEQLPFRENTFDIVINVESSHCYHPIEKFLAGVYRTLVPGGYLLITDFRDLVRLDELRRALLSCGLIMLEEKNISENVLKAIKTESPKRAEAIERNAPEYLWPILNEFGAVQGSRIYQALEDGSAKYMTYVLQKGNHS